MNKAIPRANRPPKESASDGLKAVAAEEEEAVDEEEVEVEVEVEEVPEAELLSDPELLLLVVVPAVPLETALPGRLTVAFAARS